MQYEVTGYAGHTESRGILKGTILKPAAFKIIYINLLDIPLLINL